MPHTDQADLFVSEAQAELFTADPVVCRTDPDTVRARLHKLLAEARAAQALSWGADRGVSLCRTIFPLMTSWVREDEAAQLRFTFDAEMARPAP